MHGFIYGMKRIWKKAEIMLNPEIEIQILNESEMLNRMVKSYKTYVLFTPIILTNSKSYPRIVEMFKFSRIEYQKSTSLDFAKN